jgi:hypothetical protein
VGSDSIENLIENTLVGSKTHLNASATEMLSNLVTTIMNAGIYATGGNL